MVDAAVGSKSVLGRALEAVQGLPQVGGASDFKFLNFISADLARASNENKSLAITGFGGEDRGTPGGATFEKKLKYDMTVDRILIDLVAMFGKPTDATDMGAGMLTDAVTITTPGSGYEVGDPVTFAGTTGTDATGVVSSIDGSGGVTGVTMTFYGTSYTGTVNADFSGGHGTLAVATGTLRSGPWIVRIRPGAASPTPRYLSTYFYEGGSYTAMLQQGRRCSGVTLTDAANKRVEVDPAYTEPIGDTVTGFPIAKTGHAGTQNNKLFWTRGRRPYDANYDAKKSLYLKVISTTATSVTFAAAFDTASGHTDGSGFPSTTFGTAHFTVNRADWGTAVDSNDPIGAPIGLFGENFEPYEITIGDQAGTLFTANDIFEIPYTLSPIDKQVVAENRLSTFHLTNAIAGASVLVDSGTTKWDRPYKEYYSNSRKFPSNVDPTGDIMGTMQFKKRLFDVAFRKVQESASRVAAVQTYRFGQPIIANVHEGIEIFYPQMRVGTMKSGDVPNKNTLEETITLEAEQPDANPSQPVSILTPGGNHFDTSAQYPYQINAVTVHDPAYLMA
jgi:hypothetical protein